MDISGTSTPHTAVDRPGSGHGGSGLKYLGVHLHNNLDWSHKADVVDRKGQSHLHTHVLSSPLLRFDLYSFIFASTRPPSPPPPPFPPSIFTCYSLFSPPLPASTALALQCCF